VTSDPERPEEDGADEGRPFSAQLESWLVGSSPKTLGNLTEVFAEKAFAVTILFLMFVPALPAPTGGITHVFELITVLLAVQLVLGRSTVWIPGKWSERELGSIVTDKAVPFMVRRIAWFERFARPRWAGVFHRRWFDRILGIVFIAFATGAALAPPFTGLDTLPALGAVAVALAMVLEDVVVLGVGLALGTAGIALTLTIGASLIHFVGGFF